MTNYAVRASSPPMVERRAHLNLLAVLLLMSSHGQGGRDQLCREGFVSSDGGKARTPQSPCSPPSHVQSPLCTRGSSSHKPSLVRRGRTPWSLSRTPACRWVRQQDDRDGGEEEVRGGRGHDPGQQRPNLPEEPPKASQQISLAHSSLPTRLGATTTAN